MRNSSAFLFLVFSGNYSRKLNSCLSPQLIINLLYIRSICIVHLVYPLLPLYLFDYFFFKIFLFHSDSLICCDQPIVVVDSSGVSSGLKTKVQVYVIDFFWVEI